MYHIFLQITDTTITTKQDKEEKMPEMQVCCLLMQLAVVVDVDGARKRLWFNFIRHCTALQFRSIARQCKYQT
jgi:hypothetical protein